MDYEKKYNEALKLAASYYGNGTNEFLDTIFPELSKSDDERIRKWLVDYFTEIGENWIHREFTCKQIVAYLEKLKEFQFEYPGLYFYDGEKLRFQGNPAIEEKQKEQKPVEPSNDELQRHQDELHNFKVFAVKQAKEHHIHISFVHDFEWNNFCAELLSYFNEQKTKWNTPKINGEPIPTENQSVDIPLAEWSEADEEVMEDLYNFIISDFIQDHIHETRWKPWKTTLERNRQNRLKSLRPQSKEELAKIIQDEYNKGKELGEREGFTQGYIKGYKDAYEPISYRFPIPSEFGCDGTHCTNPQMDCINCPHRGDMFLLTQGVKSGKHELVIEFMSYLDENRTDGKMGLSNGECEDIDKAFKENDWAKIMRYAEKYGKKN